MNLVVEEGPPFEPVILTDLYKSLRLDTEGSPETHFDDALLSALIVTAREHIESMARRSLVKQILKVTYAGFPVSQAVWETLSVAQRLRVTPKLSLPRPPVQYLLSLHYYDSSNALTEVDSSNYYLVNDTVPYLGFVTGFSPPEVYPRADAVQVRYAAGYFPDGSPPTTQEEYAANVPGPLKRAIILKVRGLYDSLTPADEDKLNAAIEALVQPKRIQLSV